MTKISKEEFIQQYTEWLRRHLGQVLPSRSSKYRMVEITRRQHHHDVVYLLKQMETSPEELSG